MLGPDRPRPGPGAPPRGILPATYGREGEIASYDEGSPQIRGAAFIFDDTALDCWGEGAGAGPEAWVDGQKIMDCHSDPRRDLRNPTFTHARLRLGDRHVLELRGERARLSAVDAKVCPDRRFIAVGWPAWRLGGATVTDFASDWGALFGVRQALLEPGAAFELDVVATDLSVAYVDTPGGGQLRVLVDGQERLLQPTNTPFVDVCGKQHFMANRRGILNLGLGWHAVRREATGGRCRSWAYWGTTPGPTGAPGED